MEKKLQLNKNVMSKLKAYSAVAAAVVATGQAADGQNVVYTDINPDVTLTQFPDSFLIDFDGDGVNDINLNLTKTDFGSYTAWFMKASPVGTATSLVSSASYVAKLNAGDTISPTNAFVNSGYALALYSNWFYSGTMNPFGNFGGQVNDGYVGVKFDISGSTHYGWIRVSTNNADSVFSVTIKDFAYDTRDTTPILAGDTTGILVGINQTSADIKFNLYPNPSNGKFKIESSEDEMFISIRDIMGKEIFSEKIQKNAWIDLTDKAKGTYFIQIKTEKGIKNEKIVIN